MTYIKLMIYVISVSGPAATQDYSKETVVVERRYPEPCDFRVYRRYRDGECNPRAGSRRPLNDRRRGAMLTWHRTAPAKPVRGGTTSPLHIHIQRRSHQPDGQIFQVEPVRGMLIAIELDKGQADVFQHQ